MTLGIRKETYGFLLNLPLIGGIKKKGYAKQQKETYGSTSLRLFCFAYTFH